MSDSTSAIVRVSCSEGSFGVKESSVLHINIFDKASSSQSC